MPFANGARLKRAPFFIVFRQKPLFFRHRCNAWNIDYIIIAKEVFLFEKKGLL
jgi:hypothetical protein